MNIDARTTEVLFKAKPFWNGFGVFATYEHTLLLKEAIEGSMRQHAVEVKNLYDFERKLNAAIEFLTERHQQSPLEKEIGESIDQINIKNDSYTYNPVDLDSSGVLDLLEKTKEMPKREMKSLLNQILALKQMARELSEAIDEGVNEFKEETELEVVRRILHHDFDLDVLDARLDEVRKEPLSDIGMDLTLKQSLSLANDLEKTIYQPVFEMIFQAIEREKQKQTEQTGK